jgi:hypothetical protein
MPFGPGHEVIHGRIWTASTRQTASLRRVSFTANQWKGKAGSSTEEKRKPDEIILCHSCRLSICWMGLKFSSKKLGAAIAEAPVGVSIGDDTHHYIAWTDVTACL